MDGHDKNDEGMIVEGQPRSCFIFYLEAPTMYVNRYMQ